MSWAEIHSSREWKLCWPVNRLGVGRPISERIEPSVPPRIAALDGLEAGAADRLARVRPPRAGKRSSTSRMFRYCSLHLERHARARPVGDGRERQLREQRLLLGEPGGDEVADDELDRRAVHAGDSTSFGCTKPSRSPVVSGARPFFGRRFDEVGGDLDRVDHLARREPGCVLKPWNVTCIASAENVSHVELAEPPRRRACTRSTAPKRFTSKWRTPRPISSSGVNDRRTVPCAISGCSFRCSEHGHDHGDARTCRRRRAASRPRR